MKLNFSCNEILKGNLTNCIFATILILLLCLILIIIFLLAEKFSSSSKNDQLYLIGLLIACSSAFIIIFVIVYFILKGILFLPKLHNWKIKNFNCQEHSIERVKYDRSKILPTTEGEIALRRAPSPRFNEKKALSPKIVPLSFTPIFDKGKFIGYSKDYCDENIANSCFHTSIQSYDKLPRLLSRSI